MNWAKDWEWVPPGYSPRMYTTLATLCNFLVLFSSCLDAFLMYPFPPLLLVPQMSKTTNSWITELTEVFSASASSPSLSTAASATARFVSVGSRMVPDSTADVGSGDVPEGEYDGGAKGAHLFLFNAAAQSEDCVCLGFVGQENLRFCLRPATLQDSASGKWFCGFQRHLVQFEPVSDTFYPRANEIIAFCTPSFPLSVVPADKVLMVKTTKRSIPEWSQLFKSFLDGSSNVATGAIRQIGFSTTFPLKTPSKNIIESPSACTSDLTTPAGLQQIEEGSYSISDSAWESLVELAGVPGLQNFSLEL
jgi:hypothetical protein